MCGLVSFLSILQSYFVYMIKKLFLLAVTGLVLFSCGSSKPGKQPTDKTATNDTNTKPGWQIIVNKQLVLRSNTEDIETNVKTIPAKDLFAEDGLKIVYTEAPDAALNRSFIIMNEGRQELLRIEKKDTVISGSALQKAVGSNRTIVIYSLAIPSDPALAATVRVRPVHLCTLILQ